MLRIYDDCLEMLREVEGMAVAIERRDRDRARQVRRSGASVHLNVAEGSGCRGGTRRMRYQDALGSARETVANLEGAAAVGFVRPMSPQLRGHFNKIIGTLVTILHK